MSARKFPIRERGFSLLEVLVAFVVLTLIGTALFRLFGGALNNAGASEAWSRALLVAQNQLAQATIAQPLRATTNSGRDGDIAWTLHVEAYTPPADEGEGGGSILMESPMFKLYRLQVDVHFPGVAGTDRTLSLATLKVGQEGQMLGQ